MQILVIDGQGGGVGRALVERLKGEFPDSTITALGTNVLATTAMLKAGADHAATGENAIIYNAPMADIILGPIGILSANSMLGELSPGMAAAVGASRAVKILLPVGKCKVRVAGAQDVTLAMAIDAAVGMVKECRGGL